jgi:hypothetical protein
MEAAEDLDLEDNDGFSLFKNMAPKPKAGGAAKPPLAKVHKALVQCSHSLGFVFVWS